MHTEKNCPANMLQRAYDNLRAINAARAFDFEVPTGHEIAITLRVLESLGLFCAHVAERTISIAPAQKDLVAFEAAR